MPDFRDSKLTLRIADGREFERASAYSVSSGYLTSTDAFDVTLFEEDRAKLSRLELQACDVVIDGAPQLAGRIEVTERGGGEGTSVLVRGRDYIADLVECHMDPSFEVKKEETLGAVVLRAAGVCGVLAVMSGDAFQATRNVRTGVSTSGGTARDFSPLRLENYKPNPGEGVYAFCNRLVARHGATIQPTNDRAVVALTAPGYTQPTIGTIRRLLGAREGATNLVMSGRATRDFTAFPSYLLVSGRAGPTGTAKVPGTSVVAIKPGKKIARGAETASVATELNGELAEILDGAVADGRRLPSKGPFAGSAMYRLHYSRDNESRNQAQVDAIAMRAFAQKFKDTLIYDVTVRGHADPETGALWAVDSMVRVQDEVCEIDEPMWIAARTFEFSPQSGTTTRLECWRPGAFQIDPGE